MSNQASTISRVAVAVAGNCTRAIDPKGHVGGADDGRTPAGGRTRPRRPGSGGRTARLGRVTARNTIHGQEDDAAAA